MISQARQVLLKIDLTIPLHHTFNSLSSSIRLLLYVATPLDHEPTYSLSKVKQEVTSSSFSTFNSGSGLWNGNMWPLYSPRPIRSLRMSANRVPTSSRLKGTSCLTKISVGCSSMARSKRRGCWRGRGSGEEGGDVGVWQWRGVWRMRKTVKFSNTATLGIIYSVSIQEWICNISVNLTLCLLSTHHL